MGIHKETHYDNIFNKRIVRGRKISNLSRCMVEILQNFQHKANEETHIFCDKKATIVLSKKHVSH